MTGIAGPVVRLEAVERRFSDRPALDGISLLRVLQRDGQEFDRPLHWRMNHRG